MCCLATIRESESIVLAAELSTANQDLSYEQPDGGEGDAKSSVNCVDIHWRGPVKEGRRIAARSLAQQTTTIIRSCFFKSAPIPAYTQEIGSLTGNSTRKMSVA